MADAAEDHGLHVVRDGPDPLASSWRVPNSSRLDELARHVLSANHDPRRVTADVRARYFCAELDDHSLTPGTNPRVAPTRFEDWLRQSTARQTSLATTRMSP